MKRLSKKQRLRLIRIQCKIRRRPGGRPTSQRNAGYTARAKNFFNSARAKLRDVPTSLDRNPGFLSFLPPRNFSLTNNYDETMAFIYAFKSYFSARTSHLCDDGVKRRVYADFSGIEEIGSGAGLILAAEIHRYSQSRPGKIQVHDHKWSANVRDYFHETGLFELLNIDPKAIPVYDGSANPRQTLKFMHGKTSSGAQIRSLINQLQGLAGKPVGSRTSVYNAIAEALANVKHAYPDSFRAWPYRTSRQWWTSGFWEPSSKTVGLQLYDQGAGIPSTLPSQTYWPKILKMLEPERNDAGLIAAAMAYGRTSTGQTGRGKGLSEMAHWIESSGSGFLKIQSGHGQVTYRPGEKIDKKNVSAPLFGTLVQWEVSLAD